eukprot:89262_1
MFLVQLRKSNCCLLLIAMDYLDSIYDTGNGLYDDSQCFVAENLAKNPIAVNIYPLILQFLLVNTTFLLYSFISTFDDILSFKPLNILLLSILFRLKINIKSLI